MKKIAAFIAVFLSAAILFASGIKDPDSTPLVVGATSKPHAEMLKIISSDLAKHGIILEIVESDDYEQMNADVENGKLDANFFQHIPYMEEVNKEKGYHLVNAGGIHIEPIALYSKNLSSIKNLRTGATIAIANDPSNRTRSLLLLQSAGLIQLNSEASGNLTLSDITINFRALKFLEIEASFLVKALNDVDAVVITGNYAIAAGLSAAKDGIIVEQKNMPYINIVTVKEGSQNDPRIIALVKALKSRRIRNYITEKYPSGEVIAAF
ncbi:MAG: methionine ABC transporter substrate-binding protein [Spirochaetaceae bacterium]|nr:methionine ABC transporter substrate-binding protein [Spirochaetaceae bacterium]